MCTSSEHGPAQIFFWFCWTAEWDGSVGFYHRTLSRSGWVTERSSPFESTRGSVPTRKAFEETGVEIDNPKMLVLNNFLVEESEIRQI